MSFHLKPSPEDHSAHLFVKCNYCRRIPDFPVLLYTVLRQHRFPRSVLHLPRSPSSQLFFHPTSFLIQLCVQFSSSDVACLVLLARGRIAPCFDRNKVLQGSTQPDPGLKNKYMGQSYNSQESKSRIQKKINGATSLVCISRGCRVRNARLRKVSHDSIRPDFQLGREEALQQNYVLYVVSVRIKAGVKRNKSSFKLKHSQFTR